MPSAFPTKWLFLVLLYAAGLCFLGYCIPRTDFPLLFSVYSAVFACFLLLLRNRGMELKWVLAAGIFLRLLLFGMEPNWSDDLHRFVWDGRIVANGADPYEKKPSELLDSEFGEEAGLDSALWESLNSPDYYSVYPPVDQFVFAGTALIAGKDPFLHTLLLRTVLFLADIGSLLLLFVLLGHFALPKSHASLYFLNPLLILEGVGNLHFEPLMILFLLAVFYLLWVKGKLFPSGVLYGLAVGTKLIPLLFLPFFIRRMGWRVVPFYLVVGVTLLLSFLPWLSWETLRHFGASLNLYFQTFEFNGGIYSLVRWLGFQWKGYNIIAQLGPLLSSIVFLSVMTMAFCFPSKKNGGLGVFILFLFALSIHLLLATTVHPWYLLTMLAFLPFVPLRYPLLWSYLVVLSYAAYSHGGSVPIWALITQYGLLFVMIGQELLKGKWKKEKTPIPKELP